MRSKADKNGKHGETNARQMFTEQNGRSAPLGKKFDNREIGESRKWQG